jgi:uncharacterized protein
VTNYIVYHEVKPGIPCPDGLASAWVTSKAVGNAEFVGRMYNDDREWTFEPEYGDTIYLVDFSLSVWELQGFISGIDVIVLDHHKTAWDDLKDAEWQVGDNVKIIFDMNECGASLCWRHFFPNEPMPAFLSYVKDRDLWQHQLPQTEEVHAAYAKLGRAFELYDRLAAMSLDEFLAYMVPIGEPAVTERKAKTKAIASRHTLGAVAGYNEIPFVALAEDGSEDWLTSDVCQRLYQEIPEAAFVACLVPSSGTWSLRSDQHGSNTDVGAIAKANGGGGHRNAAGFKIA